MADVIHEVGVVEKFFLKIIKKPIKKLLTNPALKRFLASKINEKVDIPKLDEKKEQKLFEAILEGLIEFIEASI